MNLIWNCQNTNTSCFRQKKFIYWATMTISTSGALYWMRQLFMNKSNFFKIGCSLSNERFPIVPVIKIVIWTQNCFQKTYSYVHVSVGILDFFYVRWTKNLNLMEPLAMGNRTWSSYLGISKFLHAKLHDAAAAVRAQSGKSSSYCYMVGREPNSYLIGQWLNYSFALT